MSAISTAVPITDPVRSHLLEISLPANTLHAELLVEAHRSAANKAFQSDVDRLPLGAQSERSHGALNELIVDVNVRSSHGVTIHHYVYRYTIFENGNVHRFERCAGASTVLQQRPSDRYEDDHRSKVLATDTEAVATVVDMVETKPADGQQGRETVRVSVNPSLYEWALERSRLDPDELVTKFPKLREWMASEREPTLRQVEQFARATNTAVGYYFLAEPPNEEIPIPDLRTVRDHAVSNPSGDLLDTIYLCQQRQDWYRDYARSAAANRT